jgi:hypothetical protein
MQWRANCRPFQAVNCSCGYLADSFVLLRVQNSAHFANEQRKQAQTNARIARLKAQAAQVTPAQLAASQR